jgi:hypothetical protein
MILRRSRSPPPDTRVGHTIIGLPQDLVQEQHIVGHHASGKSVFVSVAALDNFVNLGVLILDDQLEWAEKLLWAEFEVSHVDVDGDW